MKKKWRLIISNPADAVENMALDEAIFLLHDKKEKPLTTLRIYSWSKPCVTLGYFQKYPQNSSQKYPIVRRMTGGLTVLHGGDISYCFVTNKNDWEHIYDQNKTYQAVHAAIKEALKDIGIATDFYEDEQTTAKNNLCTQTFFKHDLHTSGKKIVGSSQRRRNTTLLQQGSIQLDPKENILKFSTAAKKTFEKTFKVDFSLTAPSSQELTIKNELKRTKYQTPAWNNKF